MDVRAGSSDTVLSIKNRVLADHGVPPMLQKLMFGGRELEDSATLKSENVSARTTLHLGLVERAFPLPLVHVCS